MNRYAVIIEKGQFCIEKGQFCYGAYVPDLPGCAAVADSEGEVCRQIAEAIDFPIEGLRLAAEAIPKPSISVEYNETPNGEST